MVHRIKKSIRSWVYKKNRKKGKGLDGSYTVEMALLFPIILGVLLFILGLTFYLYDVCVLDISANFAAIKGQEFLDMSERNRERKIRKIAEEEVADSLIAMKNLMVSVQVEKEKVVVSYSGEYVFPVINLFLGGKGEKQKVSIQAESVIQNAVEWIQTIRKAGRIAGYIKECVK